MSDSSPAPDLSLSAAPAPAPAGRRERGTAPLLGRPPELIAGDPLDRAAPLPPVGSQRPGGRTARTRAAVLDAARRILTSEGAVGLRVEAIAVESGVHRSSIYRRWGTAAGVVADLAEDVDASLAVPSTGTLGGDLRMLAEQLAARLDGDGAALARALLAWPDPEIRRVLDTFWTRRRTDAAEVLHRYDIDVDASLVLRLVAGPLHYSALIEGRIPDHATIDAAVTAALALIEPGKPGAGQH